MRFFLSLLLFLILFNLVLLLLSYWQQKKNPVSRFETGPDTSDPVEQNLLHIHELNIKDERGIRWYDPARSGAAVSEI